MLLYTSGSTGQPKGVMQSFGRISRAIECALSDPNPQLPESVERRRLSYLPLAHAYERAVAFGAGGRRKLMNDSCRDFVTARGRRATSAVPWDRLSRRDFRGP